MEDLERAERAKALYTLAAEKMHRNLLHDALRDLEQAIRLTAGKPLYVSQYGLCLAQSNQLDRGLDFCRRAAKASPRDPHVRINLGRVYRIAGDAAAAHRCFMDAWKVDRRDPAAAAELACMGVRRPPVLAFLPRSHWCNRTLGQLRSQLEHANVPQAAH
jgi:Flp pilus assembly protein TadD